MNFGLLIDGLVAVLLLVTIGYCVMLNTRLKLLKADESALKSTIAELINATENAERAVAGLKATARDCELTLAERLRNAERLSADMERQTQVSEAVLQRLSRIIAAARPSSEPDDTPELQRPGLGAPDPKSMAAAAHAIAERARRRMSGLAA
jgi:hypothetical protein